MKIIVTGPHGQLGTDIVKQLGKLHEVYALDRNKLDVTSFTDCRVIKRIKPDVVIHCAAYTHVDLAEQEVDQAFLVNATGSRNIAIASEEVGAKVVFISTDYVFDGNHTEPYLEDDTTNPISIYGKSKLAGEQYVQSHSSKYFIVRTSWLYGSYGNNFVKTMLRLSNSRDEITVVSDQVGSPTYTVDVVKFLIELIKTEHYGIYHVTNTGSCSWFEFAEAIFEISKIKTKVLPCTTEEYPTAAVRPKYSVLGHKSMISSGFQELRPWKEALEVYLSEGGK